MKGVLMYTRSTGPGAEDEEYFTTTIFPSNTSTTISNRAEAGKDRTRDEETGRSVLVSLGADWRRPRRRLESVERRRAHGREQDELAMDVEARKRSLRYFFAKVVEPLGDKFTPDQELQTSCWNSRRSSRRHMKPVLPMSGANAEPRREHEDRLPVYSLPSGSL